MRVFVIQASGKDVGQIRFLRDESGYWEVSIYLLKEHTGRGIGVDAIKSGCAVIAAEDHSARFVAFTLADNGPSQSAFRKAGFRESEFSGSRPNHVAYLLNS